MLDITLGRLIEMLPFAAIGLAWKTETVLKKMSSVTMGCYFIHRLIGCAFEQWNMPMIEVSPILRCTAIYLVSMLISYLISIVPCESLKSIVT